MNPSMPLALQKYPRRNFWSNTQGRRLRRPASDMPFPVAWQALKACLPTESPATGRQAYLEQPIRTKQFHNRQKCDCHLIQRDLLRQAGAIFLTADRAIFV